MEKIEKSEGFQASDFEISDCIEVLRNLQERTRCYVHFFREMGEDYCKKIASFEKAALERAIQALLSLDTERCQSGDTDTDPS